MPQGIWALTLLLVAFVVAALDGTLASGAIGQDLHSSRRNLGKKLAYSSSWSSSLKKSKPNKELLKTVEHQLLTMFGLNSRPKPRNNITISDYMWELYKKQNKLNRSLNSRANTVRCFRGKAKNHRHPHQASYTFNIRNIPNHETIWAAELVLFNRESAPTSSSNGRRPSHRVNIFDVLRHSDEQSEDSILRLVDTQFLKASRRGSSGHWVSFDVLPALHRWRKEPSANHGLHVKVDSTSLNSSSSATHQLRLKRQTGESYRKWLQYQPLLVTYSRDSSMQEIDSVSHRRTRRNTRKHRRKGRKDNCRRHALYVDFSDVGWNDWIVAPPGYDAYFCSGECPFPLADHLNSTNHAIVQTLVNSVNPAAVPRVCCVPTELSPISMLYVDEYDKVVLKNYQDMVVQGCGCR